MKISFKDIKIQGLFSAFLLLLVVLVFSAILKLVGKSGNSSPSWQSSIVPSARADTPGGSSSGEGGGGESGGGGEGGGAGSSSGACGGSGSGSAAGESGSSSEGCGSDCM